MAPILIVAGDPDLRTLLRMLLRRQYILTEVTSAKAGLGVLHASTDPFVVIVLSSALLTVGEKQLLMDRDHDPDLARHAFLLLTTDPAGLSRDMRWRLAQLQIPVIGVPFDLDLLLHEITMAQVHLAQAAAYDSNESGA